MIPWNRKWQPIPVFLPRKVHEHGSLAGYNPWDRRESDTTEHTCIIYHLLLQIIRSLLRLSEFTSLVHEKLSRWHSICSASCCKDKSDDFQALYMSKLKQEILWGKSINSCILFVCILVIVLLLLLLFLPFGLMTFGSFLWMPVLSFF